MHYDVVVASFRLNAAEPPGKVLERVLGVSADQAKTLLRRFPAVVVSRVEEGRALEVVALLEASGAKAEVCESAPLSEPVPQAPMSMPVAQGFVGHSAPPLPASMRGPTPFVATSAAPGSAVASVRAAPPMTSSSSSGVHAVEGSSDFPDMPSMPVVAPPPPVRAKAAPAMPSLESLPPLDSASPANEEAPQAPPEEERPSGQRKRPMTAYQLGDLDLGGAAKAPPAARPAQPVLPAQPAPVADLSSEPPAADSGAGLELELASVRPVAPAKATRAAQAASPAAANGAAAAQPDAVAKVAAAAKPATAPKAAAPGAASSDGMQTFGDGFDDMETAAPALELDRENRWKDDKVVGLHKAKPPAAAAAAAVQRPTPARRPTRITRRGSFVEEWGDSVLEFLKFALGLTLVLVIALAIVSFIRDPEAMEELCGLAPPPPMEDLVEGVMQDGVKLSKPSPVAQGKDASGTLGDVNLTVSTADAPLHPLLRLTPNVARVFVAARLRGLVSDVEEIELKGLAVPPELGLHVDCMLVQHHPRDLRDRDAATRVEALLRTGYALDLPEGGQRLLAKQIDIARAKAGPKSRFTPVCLAL